MPRQSQSRTDAGILNFFDDVLSNLFGLSSEVVDNIHKSVRAHGEIANLKDAVRALDYSDYQRIVSSLHGTKNNDDSGKSDGSADDEDVDKSAKKEASVKEGKRSFLSQAILELDARQSAKSMTDTKGERVRMGKETDVARREELEKQIKGLEKSGDPDERLLARKMKEVASLRKKIENK